MRVLSISIKMKMILAFLGMIAIIAALGIGAYWSTNTSNVRLREIGDEILPNALDFLSLQRDVIQIQQWLTDISATRGLPGYDDGFDEAATHYESATATVQVLITQHRGLGENDVVQELEKISRELYEYYATGQEMARSYIESGPEAGNLMMDEFDQYASRLNESLDGLVETHVTELTSSVTDIERVNAMMVRYITIVSAAALLISVGIAFLLIRGINRGLTDVLKYASALSAGRLCDRGEVQRRDEFGTLMQNFNDGFEGMCGLIRNVMDTTEKTSELNESLAGSTEQVTASVTEMNANMGSMRDQVERQNNAVSESSTAVEQIAANINSLTEQIERQAGAVTESSAAVEEMAASISNIARLANRRGEEVSNLLEVIERADRNVDATDSVIKDVAALSASMLEVIGVINNISSQTNLLAMNAAIEAAHAGEAGKGFAVVSDEIRKLAEDTSANSKSISETLRKIDEIIKTAIEASDENKGSFSQLSSGVAELTNAFQEVSATMAELDTGAREINSAITELSNITQSIQTASTEINGGAGDISSSMTRINEISGEILSGMREMNSGIDEISSAMNSLRDLSVESREAVDRIEEEIGKFSI